MKMRRWLLIAALLVASAGLGVALWWSYQPSTPGAPPRVTTLGVDRIHRIQVRHGSDLIMLKRAASGSSWRLVSPVSAAIDKTHLKAVLSLAGRRAARRYAPGAIADATTGLDNPALVVRFNRNAPIRIGGRGPSRDSRYVATAHDLLLANLPDLAGLEWGWTHWISPALVPPGRHLKHIVLPNFTLARHDGKWRAQPAAQRATVAVAATVNAWQSAQALTVVPADHSRQRTTRITLDFNHGLPRHLDVIERDPNLILRNPDLGVDYHLAGNRVAPLLDLRHPGLATSFKEENSPQ